MKFARLVILALLYVSAILTQSGTNIHPVDASHMASIALYADTSAFNHTSPSGDNPSLTVLANDTLHRTFAVTLIRVNSVHNFAIYTSTGQFVARSPDVTSARPATTDTYQVKKGVYNYVCEYHENNMIGQLKAIQPDVDGDGDVDLDDLIDTFLNQFGTNLTYDIDLDGDVDLDDLITVFLHQFV